MEKNDSKIVQQSLAESPTHNMPLQKGNFIGMAIAGGLIVLGFLLMLGSSTTSEGFNPDIFSFRRIVLGPAITFIGFVLMAVAIIIDPQKFTRKNK